MHVKMSRSFQWQFFGKIHPMTITVDGTGVSAPSLDEAIADFNASIRAIFGQSLSLAPQTPQGQIATAIATVETMIGEAIVKVGNATSIERASGAQLDALGSLLRVARSPARRSHATATLTGVGGTIVPAGALAKTPEGDQFRAVANIAISPTGVDADFESVEYGPVPAAAGALSAIVTIIAGWESITNSEAAEVGALTQTDASYRQELLHRTTMPAKGPLAAMQSAMIMAKAGKTRIIENPTNTAATTQLWRVDAHSILAIAEQGIMANVARAVEEHRGMGVGTMAAIQGGTPGSGLYTLSGASLIFGGTAYTGLTTTGATTPAGVATLVNALSGIPLTLHDQGGRFVALFPWQPGEQLIFADDTVSAALGLDPDSAASTGQPFVRPQTRTMTITAAVTKASGFPPDGLQQMRQAAIDRVGEYGIGETPYANHILAALGVIPGTRVTSVSIAEGSTNLDGVEPPLDTIWQAAESDVTITVT